MTPTVYCRHIEKGTIYPWNPNLDPHMFEKIPNPIFTETIETQVETTVKPYVMKPYKPRIKKEE